jgi:hypothetical protein
VGEPVKKTKGSILIEITFWLCFLIPGLIYSLWRETTKYKACPACGNSTMISIKTPLGQELQNKLSETIPAQKADQGLAEYKARIIL